MTNLTIKYSMQDSISILKPSGVLNYQHSKKLTDSKTTIISDIKHKGSRGLIIDLAAVDYTDSSGLASLIQYFGDCKDLKVGLCLINLNTTVQEVFRITGLNIVFNLFKTYEEAVDYINK